MPTARNGAVEIHHQTTGDPNDPALLLVAGLGMQLTSWHDDWCRELADRGRFVIRFDNRDSGLSSVIDAQVDLPAVLRAWADGTTMPEVPYLLSDMAADAVAVLDDLGVDRANVVGASLGGMIVQTMAIEHPTRVATLTSIMSTTGEPAHYRWDPEVRAVLLRPPPADREGAVANAVAVGAALAGPRWFDPVAAAEEAGAAYDRSFLPDGVVRQTAAIRASGSRDEGLAGLAVPTLVIHGRADRLILPGGGEHTAAMIPGAVLLLVDDMGHDLPRPLWPLLIDAIISHTSPGTV